MMKHKDNILDFFFTLIVGSFLTFSLTSGLLAASVLGPLDLSFLLPTLLVIMLYRVLMSNRIAFAIGAGAIVLAIALLFLDLRQNQYSASWFLFFGKHITRLLAFLRGEGPLIVVSKDFIAVLLTVFIGLFVMLNIHGLFHITTITLTGIVLFTVPSYLSYPSAPRDQAIFLTCFVVILLKRLNLNATPVENNTVRRKQNATFSFFAIPLAVVCVGIALLLPKPAMETGSFVEKGARAVADTVAYTQQDTKVLSFAEDEKKIGGPIVMKNQPVMRVKAEEPLYLSTVYMDTYTGTSWKNSLNKKQTLPLDDEGYYETSPYSSEQIAHQKEQLITLTTSGDTQPSPIMRSVYIEMMDNRTSNIFSPPFRSKLIVGYEIDLQMDEAGALSSRFIMNKKQAYTQNYLSWQPVSIVYNKLPNTLTNDDIANHSLDDYLTLPDGVTLRTIDVTHELTDSYDNAYDKMSKLERYLAQFPYTLEPEPVPDGVDFVDYFLFEGQEGYCVYYATSLAVMGRIIGVPTRYVEGYVMPPKPEADGSYLVTNEQAHAWVEAYFPEFGWIAFEPTARYHGVVSDAIEPPIPPKVEENEPAIPPDTPDVTDPETNPPAQQEKAVPPEKQSTPKGSVGLLIFGIVFVVLAVLVAVVWLFYRRYREHVAKIKALSPRQRGWEHFLQIRRALGGLGYPSRSTETALQFAKRVENDLPVSLQAQSLLNIAEIYTEITYSKNAMLPEQYETVRRYRKTILTALQKENKLAFAVEKYIRLRY